MHMKIYRCTMSLAPLMAVSLCTVVITAFAAIVFAETATAQAEDDIMRPDLRISVEEVRKRVSTGSATIVDLRSDIQYRGGHIRGAISVQPHEIETRLSEIASLQAPIFLYCE